MERRMHLEVFANEFFLHRQKDQLPPHVEQFVETRVRVPLNSGTPIGNQPVRRRNPWEPDPIARRPFETRVTCENCNENVKYVDFQKHFDECITKKPISAAMQGMYLANVEASEVAVGIKLRAAQAEIAAELYMSFLNPFQRHRARCLTCKTFADHMRNKCNRTATRNGFRLAASRILLEALSQKRTALAFKQSVNIESCDRPNDADGNQFRHLLDREMAQFEAVEFRTASHDHGARVIPTRSREVVAAEERFFASYREEFEDCKSSLESCVYAAARRLREVDRDLRDEISFIKMHPHNPGFRESLLHFVKTHGNQPHNLPLLRELEHVVRRIIGDEATEKYYTLYNIRSVGEASESNQ